MIPSVPACRPEPTRVRRGPSAAWEMSMPNLRPELEQHLRQRLEAFRDGYRHNLAVIGPSGSGKTFQLQRLFLRPIQGLTLLYCPLYRESCRGFLHRLLSTLLQVGLGGQEGVSLGTLRDRAQATLPKTAAAIQPIEALLERHLFSEAFNRALDVIPVLLEERGGRGVLILDEFLFLDELGLGHAFHELGKRVMTWSSILFILASSRPYRARAILRERLQLLFGQFELVTLDTLEEQPAESWIRQELSRLKGGKGLGAFLVWWLGGCPWYLTVLLRRIKELASLQRKGELTEELFMQAAWDVLGSREGLLSQRCGLLIEGLSGTLQGPRALETLIEMADGAKTATEIGQRIGRGGLSLALQLLVEHDLAQRNGMCWIVPDPVLRCWLSTVLWAQRADAMPDEGSIRSRFEQHLRTLWGRWFAEQKLSLADQVVQLLGRFSDETVLLDQKTGRLPRFQDVRIEARTADAVHLVAEGTGRRWCCLAAEGPVSEQMIVAFEAFCHAQSPKPSRKVVIGTVGLNEHAKVLAKAANMWVWGARELEVLRELYAATLEPQGG